MVPAVVGAQGVTLDSCRSWARSHYPLVEQYGLVAQSAEYSVVNASRAWLPQVSLSAQATWQTDAARFPDAMNTMLAALGTDLEGIRQDQYKLALDVQQNLWDGGRSKAEKRIAKAQAEADRLAADVDFHALEGRVDNLFFGILLLEEHRLQTENCMALLEENLRRCRVMAENDLLMQSDVDAVEVELLTAGQQLDQVCYSCAAYREMLSLLTGRPMAEATLAMPEELGGDLLVAERPEMRLLDARIGQSQAQEDLLRSASMPQLSLFAQGWYGYPGLNMFENMLNGDWSLNAVVGIRLAWNISAFYTQHNDLDRLHNTQRQLQVQRDVVAFNEGLRRSEQSSEMARLRKALRDDDRIVALRCSVREAAESKHRNGVIGTTELLRAITEESAAQSARLLHRIELLKKQYE